MRIAVMGTGGAGGYFGGRLAENGEEVIFIARGANLDALRSAGLRVDSPNGDFSLAAVEATDQPSEIGAVDVVLVGVKAWQLLEAAQAMHPLIGEQTTVLPLQNGVEAADQLARVLGVEHVLGGTCKIISRLEAPGHIVHTGVDPFVALGELDNRNSDRVQQLVDAFERAGVGAQSPPDIHVAIWQKFQIMAPLSGVGAVTRVPIGIFRETPETRRMLEQAIREVESLARAQGIALPGDASAKTQAIIDGLPSEGTSSMQRDVMASRPSELEAQNGAVVRLGRAAGLDTPVNSFIYRSLLPMELAARSELE